MTNVMWGAPGLEGVDPRSVPAGTLCKTQENGACRWLIRRELLGGFLFSVRSAVENYRHFRAANVY
jgi:hypothetical protein